MRYQIDFFYKQLDRGRGKYEGQFMRAMDEGGRTKWKELRAEEKAEFMSVAQTAFAEPYHSGTRETPGGTSNVKNVYEISDYRPEGHLSVGMWWDSHKQPEEYYKRMGWSIEIAGRGEGVPNSKEKR